jgi:hypothetical protein
MAGKRKMQRSVRVSVAAALMVAAAAGVIVALVTGTGVAAAAVGSVVCGLAAVRIVCTEVTQTRRDAARAAAVQSRDFAKTAAASNEEHREYTELMAERLSERDQAIVELNGALRLSEIRVERAVQRVKHEARRANEAQERLASLLDDLLVVNRADDDRVLAELPAIADLLAWEDRANESMLAELRKQA